MIVKGEFHKEITQIDHTTFEVNGATSIHFTLHEGAFEHFFVIVKDPKNTIRCLLTFKTRIKSYCLSKQYEYSDNNTIAGPLYDGTWTIDVVRTYPIHGGYKIEITFNEAVQYMEGINPLQFKKNEKINERCGWYHGDFHMHSAYSDGRISFDEIKKAMLEKQLDMISMSDHSTITTKFPNSSVLVLPATEVTWDDNGHYNIHGMKELIDYAYFISEAKDKNEALDTMFKHYRSKGCVLSINHPFPRGWMLTHDYDIRSMQMLEVVNAPHLFNEEVDNERAVKLFDYLWSQGHYLYAIGGSDAHKNNYFETYPIAIPQSNVYCEGLSIQNVLSSLCKGHLFIQIEENFEVLYHRPQDEKSLILPGDEVVGDVQMHVRCRSCVNYQLIKNGKIYKELTGRIFACDITINEGDYYRIQARSVEDGKLLLFVNPIGVHSIKANKWSFQELLNDFYEYEK